MLRWKKYLIWGYEDITRNVHYECFCASQVLKRENTLKAPSIEKKFQKSVFRVFLTFLGRKMPKCMQNNIYVEKNPETYLFSVCERAKSQNTKKHRKHINGEKKQH